MIKYIHTMLRVYNLYKSIDFYTKVFDLKIVRQNDYLDKRYTLAFLGHGTKEEDIFLELTYNWDTKKYDLGEGFGHIAFNASDLNEVCRLVVEHGGSIKRKPGILKTSKGKDVAFFEDPDGYVIEVINQ